MIIGYGRTSTFDQAAGLAAQERDLRAAGAKKLFTEQVSSVAKRDRLAECLAFLRDGDVLMVTGAESFAVTSGPPVAGVPVAVATLVKLAVTLARVQV